MSFIPFIVDLNFVFLSHFLVLKLYSCTELWLKSSGLFWLWNKEWQFMEKKKHLLLATVEMSRLWSKPTGFRVSAAVDFRRRRQSDLSTSPALSFVELLLQTCQNLPMVVSPLLHVFEERLVSLTEQTRTVVNASPET